MNQSLETVYQKHRQGLFSLALSVTGSRQQAEDSIQDAFANLMRRRVPDGDIVPYVYISVRNAAIDLQRKTQRRSELSESLFNGYAPLTSKHDNPAADLLTKERDQMLRDAVQELPKDQREAVVLKALAGLTFDQAGEVLNISPKTLATRYRRALMKLETRLRGQL